MATFFAFPSFSSCIFSLVIVLSHSFRFEDRGWRDQTFEGRYTRDITDYEVLVPRKVDHQGSFVSYSLTNFFRRDTERRKRNTHLNSERVHYGINFNGKDHVVEMWPNHGLLSPGLVLETRGPGAATDLNKLKIRSVGDTQCHYTGRVKGEPGSRVALSACDGVVGHVRMKEDHYYIEPVKGHEPEDDGQHLHLIYKRSINDKHVRSCGTSDDWETAWSNRLRTEYRQRRGSHTDLKADAAKRRSALDNKQVDSPNSRRSAEVKTNYLEVLLVADKKFLQARNGTNYEQYLFTALNMASDILHDDSTGQSLDLVLVRVIYLEKEEEEIDLIINKDADSTLTNFCKWSTRMNPVLTHPNHHDIAVLVTKYDICLGKEDCATAGLASLAGCCSVNLSCAICEDTGLVVGTIIAHEIGHLLGSDHDSDEENPPEGQCSGMLNDYNIHVMATWGQVSPGNWSICSRKYIKEFLENDLGSCLLDEPQDHDFKIPNMPAGVVYDREWQCKDLFGPTTPCNLGPERNCKILSCKPTGSKSCKSMGPPADGTNCGNNKWCFEGKCVDVGARPEAINGKWGEWGSFSECSRTCGGGASFAERKCDNPRPANHGRYCVGKHRRYKLCETQACDEDALSFREVQCKEHDKDDIKWIPFNDGTPQHVCALVCANNENIYKVVEPRVRDGTSCQRGSRDKCLAGKCRKVGCDWVLDSDAVEDICGVCNGDASTCEVIDKINDKSGTGYQKIVTIPTGSRHITVEEMKPSKNALALSAADGKTFYLNGDYTIQGDGETKIAGSISVYTNLEEDQEQLVIAGPTKEDLIVYILNNNDPNPGIHYKYSFPSTSSSYTPKFSWELVDWGPCSVFCGGGTQLSEPSCIEERGGKVSKKFCEKMSKPEVNTRICNEQACRVRWRSGEWGNCNGCVDKPGYKYRVVDCVKQSPFEDSEVIIEEGECKKEKPSGKEACTSNEPCDKSAKRHTASDRENNLLHPKDIQSEDITATNDNESKPKHVVKKACKHKSRNKGGGNGREGCGGGEGKGGGSWKERRVEEKTTERGNGKECRNETSTVKKGLVVDKVNPDKLKIIEIPMIEDVANFNLSDEALEAVGDKISSPIDMTKVKEIKGEEAQKTLKQDKKENEQKDKDKDENGNGKMDQC